MQTMTRAEYEATYGVAPVLPSASTLDNSLAPRRMTTEEYIAEFGEKNEPFLSSTKPSFPASMGGEETILPNLAKTFGNIPSSARNLTRAVTSPVNPLDLESPLNIGSNISKSASTGIDIFQKFGIKEGVKLIAEGFLDTLKKGATLTKNLGENIYQNLERNVLSEDSVSKGVGVSLGQGLSRVAQAGVEDPLLLPSLLYVPTKLGGKTDAISKFAKPVTRGADTSLRNITKGEDPIAQAERELYKVENSYVTTRKANEFSQDAGSASRQRIVRSGVLNGVVDDTGSIRTKEPGGAVDRYTKQTVDGVEDVVKLNLLREGTTINLKQIERALKVEIARSGLEGGDLISALNGVKKEVAGLRLRSDSLGSVPIVKIHEAKINTTKNINFNTPPETKTYRKAVARAYKQLVEDSAQFNVREVNAELSKYYDDIERLERLDGRKVKGGKLGRYTAQIAGNIAGGAVGGAVGGLPGAAIGTIVGGETASFVKGKMMAGTFGKVKGNVPENQILNQAKAQGKLPPQVDLTVPSPKIGVPANIPRTKEVIKLERDISNNVQAQTKAIKAKDFTLVATLKEIYVSLIEQLKEIIKKIENTPNRQGGFIKNPLSPSPKSGKSQEIQSPKLSQSSGNNTPLSPELQPLAQEARKYKSAEEFVSAKTKRPDYGYGHSPNENGVRAFDLTEKVDGEQMIPKDMYERWYGSRGTAEDLESISVLKKIKGNPEAEVTIYRASPKEGFNYGDWITLSKKYAQQHAEGNNFKVFSQKVKAKDIRWAMDDVNEFGYFPESTKSQLTDFYNKVVGKK